MQTAESPAPAAPTGDRRAHYRQNSPRPPPVKGARQEFASTDRMTPAGDPFRRHLETQRVPPDPPSGHPTISLVVPVYNEAPNVDPLLDRLLPVLRGLNLPFECIFIDDGSRDGTADRLAARASRQPEIRIVRLSRNFGHQAALVAGLEHARGQAVITMDGDLQHPPELIPQLVERWRAGFDIVQTIRNDPAETGLAKRTGSRGFYRLLSLVARIQVTPGAADFRLMSREAVQAFLACRERVRFNRGLVQWIGFTQCELPYTAARRHAGRTKYSLRAMLRLAGDAIFSFSSVPLRLAGLAGACVSLAAAGYLIFVVWAYFRGRTIEGWSSTLAAVLILGGMQLLVLWIVGEYLGRVFEELKQRPIYIARQTAAERRPAAGDAHATKRQAENSQATGDDGAGDVTAPARQLRPTEPQSTHARQD